MLDIIFVKTDGRSDTAQNISVAISPLENDFSVSNVYWKDLCL